MTNVRLIALSVGLCLVLTGAAVWLFGLSFGRAAMLAPVLMLSFGATAFLVLIWTRVLLDPMLRRRQPPT